MSPHFLTTRLWHCRSLFQTNSSSQCLRLSCYSGMCYSVSHISYYLPTAIRHLVNLNLQVEAPGSYWNVNDWCIGFQLLLDHLRLDKVHLFGASLGKLLSRISICSVSIIDQKSISMGLRNKRQSAISFLTLKYKPQLPSIFKKFMKERICSILFLIEVDSLTILNFFRLQYHSSIRANLHS